MANKGKGSKKSVKVVRKNRRAASAIKPAKKAAAKQSPEVRHPLSSSLHLTANSVRIIMKFAKPLLGIVLVYLILNIIFASGLSSLNAAVADIKGNLNNTSGTTSQPLAKAFSGFGSLVSSSGTSGSSTGSLLQSLLFIIESLVVIWALRQLLAGKAISVKEAYYHSMYPLVPFALVMVVIIIQLLPITVGATILTAVLTSAASDVTLVALISWLIFISLAAWSFYMISSSIFAIYIVTLPEMHPLQALRSAKKLVNDRRRAIIPKVVFLPVFIFVIMAIIVIPLILLASALAAPVFYVLSMLAILFLHTYLYSLYRELIA